LTVNATSRQPGRIGGSQRVEAQRVVTACLGELPLLLEIRTASDAGTPIAAAAPESPAI
jgi:ATP-binding protein involved in chromosome partitioning